MRYYGSFLSISGERVTVEIVTRADRTRSIEIGAEGGDVFFSDDPVEVTSSLNDSFDVLIRSAATVRLQVRAFLPDLFCSSCREAVVNITKGSSCIFAGFVEPQAYSQSYTEVWEELEISCIDALSALQYSRYRDIGTPGHPTYYMARTTATTRSMGEIVTSILGELTAGLRLSGTGASRVWYDGCRSMSPTKDYAVFSRIGVDELLFMGDDEEDVRTQEEVLEDVLKYLNLHIVQQGFDFYVFAWESVAGSADIVWHDLRSAATLTTKRGTVALSVANSPDTDTSISIGETFNRISLTCELKDRDLMMESPLEESALTSPYTGRQLYMREYGVEGSGKNGAVDSGKDGQAFRDLYAGKRVTHEGAYTRDWYLRVMDHPYWKFPDSRLGGANLVALYCRDNADQQALPNRLGLQPGACLVSWGYVKEMAFRRDDSVPGKLEMSTALVVAVNGNESIYKEQQRPTAAELQAAYPVAVYDGPVSGGTYSPADDETTNYVVFSGSMVLNVKARSSVAADGTIHTGLGYVFRNRGGQGAHLYGRKFFKAATPRSHPTVDPDVKSSLEPFSELDRAYEEYEVSRDLTMEDQVPKVPVLRCMLIIGGKCAVETGAGSSVNDFEWRPFKERAQCADDAEYYAQSFTLGFNPAIGDFILNTEHDISNNIPYYLGLDTEGTAIPIRRSDALSGSVRFMVLGPVDVEWEDTSQDPVLSPETMTWTYPRIRLMPYVADIIVKGFEVKLCSDNGGTELTEECDLVYVSDTGETFVNGRDDLTMRISSALTAAERRELGVAERVRYSTAIDLQSGLGVTSLYDHVKGCAVKPEQSYVDSYYAEHHEPRIVMQHRVTDTDSAAGIFLHYVHPAMPGRRFYVQALGRSLRMGEAVLTLKEVWL